MSTKNVYEFVKKKIENNHYYLTKGANIKSYKPKIVKEKKFERYNLTN